MFQVCLFTFIGTKVILTHAVVCESENTTTELFGTYSWPATPVGDTVTLRCVFRPGYNASRSCTQGGSWIAVDVTDCRISEELLLLRHY